MAASDSIISMPRGTRLRLRPHYPLNSLSQGAQVIARTLQRFGMVLADKGNVTVTVQSDKYSQAKWRNVLTTSNLQALSADDFEGIDNSVLVDQQVNCTHSIVTK